MRGATLCLLMIICALLGLFMVQRSADAISLRLDRLETKLTSLRAVVDFQFTDITARLGEGVRDEFNT